MQEIQPAEDREYQTLLNNCANVVQTTYKKAHHLLIRANHEIGTLILQSEIESKYGESTMSRLERDLRNMTGRYVPVYLVLTFAKLQSPSELDQYLAQHPNMTWTSIRENLLKGALKEPDKNGGCQRLAQDIMDKVEYLGDKLEQAKELLDSSDVDLDTKEQLVGAIQKGLELKGEISSFALPKPKTERSEKYKAYIRTYPCLICQQTPVDPHHIEKAGTGIKGSDYMTVPLCRKHHNQVDEMGVDTFEKHYNICLVTEACKLHIPYMELLEKELSNK